MEHLIEGFLELLSGLFKNKPEQMPSDIQYKDSFVVRYNKIAGIIILSILALGFIGFLIFAFIINDNDTEYLFIIFAFLSFILFLIFLFLFSSQSLVTPEKIEKTTLFIFKKEILWQDIICLRIIEKTDEESVTIALYRGDKKCVYDVSSNYENSWLLVKLAEEKKIEICKEKDLSLSQISKL